MMTVQVAAAGFELTDTLRDACESATATKLKNIALHNIRTRWRLSIQRENQICHLTWEDGPFHGNVTVKSPDMYNSILQCTKKAVEQIKKHHTKQNHNYREPVETKI